MTTGRGFFWDAVESGRPLCPVASLLGWTLLGVDDERQSLRVQFDAKPEFRNPAGNVQGGMLTAMLDETFSPALAARLGPDEFPSTLELKVNFIAPAHVGVLVGEARVVSKGKSICFLEGSLQDAAGRLVATATATALVRRLEQKVQAMAREELGAS